jgi:hypothetical protein
MWNLIDGCKMTPLGYTVAWLLFGRVHLFMVVRSVRVFKLVLNYKGVVKW